MSESSDGFIPHMGSGDNGNRVCRKSDIVAVADIASWKDIKLAAATVKVSESLQNSSF